jgi:hypothetical protein
MKSVPLRTPRTLSAGAPDVQPKKTLSVAFYPGDNNRATGMPEKAGTSGRTPGIHPTFAMDMNPARITGPPGMCFKIQ